jgi:hypothetical protein
LGGGSFQFGFINASGPSYSVLASTNLAATANTWTNLGAATEVPTGSGLFPFIAIKRRIIRNASIV